MQRLWVDWMPGQFRRASAPLPWDHRYSSGMTVSSFDLRDDLFSAACAENTMARRDPVASGELGMRVRHCEFPGFRRQPGVVLLAGIRCERPAPSPVDGMVATATCSSVQVRRRLAAPVDCLWSLRRWGLSRVVRLA